MTPSRRIGHVLGAACVSIAITGAIARSAQQQVVPQAAPAASTQDSAPKIGNGFILGTVVEATSGQPVAGATVDIQYGGPVVNAYQPGLAPVSVGVPPPIPRRVLTDAQGRFFFRQLAGGRYISRAAAPGYIGGGYLQFKPNGTSHYIDLDDDAARTEIVFRLWKYAAVSGTVLDERGEPAVGAVVHAIPRGMAGGLAQLGGNYQATTDDRGIYRIGNLSPATYIVGITTVGSTMPAETVETYAAGRLAADNSAQNLTASLQTSGAAAPILAGIRMGDLVLDADVAKTGFTIPQPTDGGKVMAYATTFYPSAPTSAQATPITLKSGEERTGIDLSLKLVATLRVSGTVMGPAGPVANMGVRLIPQGPIEFSTEAGAQVATASTDGSGAFTLLGVPTGQYVLKVLKTAVGAGRAGLAMPPPPTSEPTLWAAVPIDVADRDVTGLTVTLKNGLRLSGHVEFEGTKNKPTPDEMARIAIRVTPVGPRPSVGVGPGTASADGQFTPPGGYPPGQYFVSAFMAVAGWSLKSVMHGQKNVADEPLDVDASDIDDLVVVFTDQTALVGGTVTDASGAMDTSAEVIVFPADSDAWKHNAFSGRRYQLLATTKTGVYEFTGLPAGDYFIVAVKYDLTDNWQDPKFIEKLVGVATRTTLKGGDKASLPLKTATVKAP